MAKKSFLKKNLIWLIVLIIGIIVGSFFFFQTTDDSFTFQFKLTKNPGFTFSDGNSICNAVQLEYVTENKQTVDSLLFLIETGEIDDEKLEVQFINLDKGVYTCKVKISNLSDKSKQILFT